MCGADAIALAGSQSKWSGEIAEPPLVPLQRPGLANRSIYDGPGLRLLQAAEGFWAIVAAQALLVSAPPAMVVRRAIGPVSVYRLLVASLLNAALAVATLPNPRVDD